MFFRTRFDRMIPVLIAMMVLMWIVLSALTGISFFGPSAYNSYTLQALAWLRGKVTVENVPHLELAVYKDQYYVSFPPVPSVVLLPFALVLGMDTPDNLLVKVYACLAVILLYRILCSKGYEPSLAAPYAFLFAFSSSLLPLTLEGAVWYHAQVLAFALACAAIYFLTCDQPTPALLLIALSVGCRPFHALYLIPVFTVYFVINLRAGADFKAVVRKLLPGIGLGLMVAVAYGIYNFARFGNPLEFGHNYLPEFSTQGGVQFSLSKVLEHIDPFVIGLPFTMENGALTLRKYGFSFLIACPALLVLICRFAVDIRKKRMNVMKAVVFATFFVHLFLLFTHRTFGAFQYGARYCVDLMPYAFLYLSLSDDTQTSVAEWICLLIPFALAIYGSAVIHL